MSTTPYSAQIRHVELLERNKNQTTSISVYRDNALVVPTEAKYTLINPESKKIVDSAVASIADNGVVSYPHTATQLPNSSLLGEGYIQEWWIKIDGYGHVFRRMSALVLRRLYPVVSDIDLTAIYSDLEEVRPSTLTSYQKYIDDAWFQILRKIRNKGMGFEYLVMSADSFYEAHRHLSLYLIFRDFHSSLGQSNGRFLDLAQEHQRMFMTEFDSINFIYDQEHQNKPEDKDSRKAAKPVIYLNGPSHRQYRRFNYWRGY
jgi:hypothetical protein